MNADDFRESPSGTLVPTIHGCMAFLPNPLPPKGINLSGLVSLIAEANLALGELSGVGRTLHNPFLLIQPFMRREAVASSKIEGTVTTLSELFLFEVEGGTSKSPDDAREVLNYVKALRQGLRRIDDMPLANRLIRECHEILLTGVAKHRGAGIIPGEFKADQNWIGARLIQNARYVPPPPKESAEAMGELEKYINNLDDSLPILVQIALIHYQFEAIHPFPDGNGRVGRLLIPLILTMRKTMSQPLLYLSDFLEKNYDEYIDTMYDVSRSGNWEGWIAFFLRGVSQNCQDAIKKAQSLQDLQADYRGRIQQARSSALLARLIDLLFESPAITVPIASEKLQIAYNAAKNNIARLIHHGILAEAPIQERPKVFWAPEIIRIVAD